MNNRENLFRSVLCIGLCVLLVAVSVNSGDFIAGITHAFVNEFKASETIDSTLEINSNFVWDNPKKYNIVGYGGGDYASAAVSNTPTDIETLKKQAETLYKNYKKSGDISEQQMGATSKTIRYGIVEVDNKTDTGISLQELLSEKTPLKNVTKEEPYILIYHTHSTEGYEMLDLGWYSNDYISRTQDKSKNMVRVGDELTKTLEDAGFKVIHDRNIYDTSYNGAYDRSRISVEKYLKEYPSIMVTLDVHRDAIHYESGTKCKPTATIKGKKAAQVMIVSGCEGNGVSGFTSWEENLKFALALQSCSEENNEGLMRPLFFCNRKYNMDVTPCSLLLEFGTDANTLEEAVYSAQLMGEALIEVLEKEM